MTEKDNAGKVIDFDFSLLINSLNQPTALLSFQVVLKVSIFCLNFMPDGFVNQLITCGGIKCE